VSTIFEAQCFSTSLVVSESGDDIELELDDPSYGADVDGDGLIGAKVSIYLDHEEVVALRRALDGWLLKRQRDTRTNAA
jgi:hypothetical protein